MEMAYRLDLANIWFGKWEKIFFMVTYAFSEKKLLFCKEYTYISKMLLKIYNLSTPCNAGQCEHSLGCE
jgi:hypothetical protein